jgi:RNA recognition motif-containing protein
MKLFVGNLVWPTTEEELSQVFEAYGIVDEVCIITERDPGRARGFGFVEMPDTREAQAAIEGLNGTALGGRTLSVTEARERDERPRRPRW